MSHQQKAPIHLFATVGSLAGHGRQRPVVIGPADDHVSHIGAYKAGSGAT
ncbi:hypothetical protein [Burkholderia stagnalis]|nr:hypothetical protein [Burkholderia stagnalis]